MLGVSSMRLDVDSVASNAVYHVERGVSIGGSRVHCAKLVPSSANSAIFKLATLSHRFKRVLSVDFSGFHMNIGVGSF